MTEIDAIQIARVCHEANRALQVAQADPTIPVAAPWDECGSEMQDSAIDGVRAVLRGADARASHKNWVRFKLEHGWTLGPVKDETLKQHPLLIPYDALPESQRVKDDLFGAIVHALRRTPEQRAAPPVNPQGTAIRIVTDYVEAHLDKTDGPAQFEVFVVWFAKTLQNWKALLSTTIRDGMYYEVTHNGDKHETYLDAYKKFENATIADEAVTA